MLRCKQNANKGICVVNSSAVVKMAKTHKTLSIELKTNQFWLNKSMTISVYLQLHTHFI